MRCLTGDTLFIGDVGRPDLRASLGWTARSWAGICTTRCTTKLLPLPDATLVYPTHGAGSLCGKISRRIRSRRWESSGGSTMRCSR